MSRGNVLVGFTGDRPASEWHNVSYLQSTAPRRNLAVSLFLILWIAVLDLLTPRTNFSVLYVVPLMLLAQGRVIKPTWRIAGLLVLLTYGVYFAKIAINPTSSQLPMYFRLVNRTLVSIMIMAMSVVLQYWLRSQEDEEYDAELPSHFQYQESEIRSTYAVLCCVPLILAIALTDFISPSNFDWAILYPIPLFLCGWTHSRRLLWSMLGLLLLLSFLAFMWGPPSLAPVEGFSLQRNRVLAGLGMTIVTLLLHYWLGSAKASTR